MASLWNVIRSEVQASVDEFREKGVVGAFRDAALDAVDIAKSGGELIMDGVQTLVGEGEEQPILRAEGVPARGALLPLEFEDGQSVQALVVGVDATSDPPRAQVTIVGEENKPPILVDVRPHGWVPEVVAGGAASLIDSLKEEIHGTVQDFREKGAVGAVRDATLDAMDILSSTATDVAATAQPAVDYLGSTAVDVANRAQPAVDLLSSTAADVVTRAQPAVDLLSSTATDVASGVQSAAAPLKRELDGTMQDFREKGAVGALKDATLDAVDLVSTSATVAAEGAMSLAAPLIDLSEPQPTGHAAGAEAQELGLLDSLKAEVKGTVQDFREKGAISTLKDATLDAADLVTGAASAAADGARSLGGSLLDMVPGQELGAAPAPAVASSAPAPAIATSPAAAPVAPSQAASQPAAIPRPAGAPQPSAAPRQSGAVPAAAPTSPSEAVAPKFKVKVPEIHRMDDGEDPPGKAKPKSIVQLRREAFERQQQQKKEGEELID